MAQDGMMQEDGVMVALQAVGWLAGTEDLLEIFMGATGASADDFRTRTEDPDFLVSVMDFLLLDDSWVQRFCEENGMAPDLPMLARQVLPGGAAPNWT